MNFRQHAWMLAAFVFGAMLARTSAQTEAEIEEWFDRGETFATRGQWSRAAPLLEKVLKAKPDDEEAARHLFTAWLATGNYDSLETLTKSWVERRPEDRAWSLNRVDFLKEVGRNEEAITELERALKRKPKDYLVEAMRADLLLVTGKKDEASAVFESLVDRAKDEVVRTAEDLTGLALAYLFYPHGADSAEQALVAAQKADEKYLRAYEVLADLYGSRKELPGDMKAEMTDVMKLRPQWPAYYLRLAEAADLRLGMAEGEKKQAIQDALSINPRYADALFHRGMSELGDALWDKAEATFKKGLETNPSHLLCLAGIAAHAYVTHDLETYEATSKKILVVVPDFGRLYRIIAEALNERRRWPESLEMMRKAVEVGPDDPQSWDDLARYAFYLGREDEGEKALRRANDLVATGSVWRNNMFAVIKQIKSKYKVIELDHYVLKIHNSDAPILERLFPSFIERSYAEFVDRYQYTPDGKILFEVFRSHDDFSVRTMGTSGLGALGVCFGPTVVMDSPKAQPANTYNWAATAHHELAHVFTLMKSRGRVPRWLTEGLSTWEEYRRSPSWGRDMESDLFDAFHNDKIFKVLEFDAGFHGPRIIFAYYQGGLASRFIEETWGFDKILRMLELYGEDKQTTAVLKEAIGITPEEYDKRFLEFVAKLLGPMERVPNYDDDKVAEFKKAIAADDANDDARIKLAFTYLRSGRTIDADDAIKPVLDRETKDVRVKLFLAERAVRSKILDVAEKNYREALEAGSKDFSMLVWLAKRAEKNGSSDEAVALWEKAATVNPWEINPQISPTVNLVRLYEGSGRIDDAMAELEKVRALVDTAVDVRNKLIEYRSKRGEDDAVLKLLDELDEINPFDAAVPSKRAGIFIGRKLWDAARVELERVLDCAPDPKVELATRRDLGRVFLELGKPDDALYHLDRARQIDGNDREVRELIEKAEGK